MSQELKSYSFTLDRADDQGYFCGYASVFSNVDQQSDVVVPGAFAGCDPKQVKLLWQHEASEPIGCITTLREDKRGLFVEAKLALGVQRGKEAYALLRDEAISGLSIGYTVIKSTGSKPVRFLEAVQLWEISLVTFPSNAEALVTYIKSVHQDGEPEDGIVAQLTKELEKLVSKLK